MNETSSSRTRAAFSPKSVTLTGRTVMLVPLTLEHAPELFRAGSDDSIWLYLPHARYRSVDETRERIADAIRAVAEGNEIAFAIVERETGAAIGSTRYCLIERAHRHLEIGWTWVAPAFQRTSVNTECKYLLLRHAFEALGAIRVSLKTDGRNTRSQNAIRRIGATYEGTLRKHRICWDGHIRDTVYFSIVEDEWPEVKFRLEEMLQRNG